jgi:hypothetical protein
MKKRLHRQALFLCPVGLKRFDRKSSGRIVAHRIITFALCQWFIIQIIVTGKVQGVFFRASAQKMAELLGVTGYVCDQPGWNSLYRGSWGRRPAG